MGNTAWSVSHGRPLPALAPALRGGALDGPSLRGGALGGRALRGGARGPAQRWAALLLAFSAACAGTAPQQSTTPTRKVDFEELRINAKAQDGGGYEFESYDAAELFKRATELLNAQKCEAAVSIYDKLVAEFSASEYVSAALYNAGLCLQALGQFGPAAEHYSNVRRMRPDSDDVKDASFLLAEVLIQLERWKEAQTIADELLAREDLSQEERLEGMARRAQALLGSGAWDEAERYAQSALSYFRTRPKDKPIRDEFFAAACNYVLAESYRMRAEAEAFPQGIEAQKQVLIHRAQLLLQAQREYFNTCSFQNLDNLHWAAASGYRIGHMYDELWHAVMNAPVPQNLKGAAGEAAYHEELAKLIKPLIRHAIRYWEMTLMFIERTGMKSVWAEKTKADLVRVRALLLEQPPGEGGLPPAAASTAPAPAPAAGSGAAASSPAMYTSPANPAAEGGGAAAGAPARGAPPREPSLRSRGAAKSTR
jgi:tetratricopeptide (TPR) repeat protein